ncbi:MAG: methyltransferase [Clostridiales bacterium]|nr:methyltransferase [Clostridiales bacterium]
MNTSRRENFRKTLRHEQPESLIVDFGGNPLSSMEGRSMYALLEHLGYDIPDEIDVLPFGKVPRMDERILSRFDIDTRSVGEILRPADSLHSRISDSEYIDEWGILRVYTGMYWEIAEHPLKGASAGDLEHYRWPCPDSIDMAQIAACAERARQLFEETDYVVCAEHPVYGIFELGCWMCGFDDFLMKMALDEAFVHRFFEIALRYQKKVIEKYYGALGKFIHYTSSGDDFATQSSLFVSPDMFRRLIKPYFKERIEYTKSFTDAAYLHHSCGSVFHIIDDLIGCGVDILNPIQPKAANMQPEKLKSAYGDRIVFHGGIDTQDILPFGTKESIEETVKTTIEAMGRDGGYILAAAHNIQEDVRPQNLIYMLDAAKKFGRAHWQERQNCQ